jgi:ppGpp synthetase/RelA/SpoT-type nucleotidyltranferase
VDALVEELAPKTQAVQDLVTKASSLESGKPYQDKSAVSKGTGDQEPSLRINRETGLPESSASSRYTDPSSLKYLDSIDINTSRQEYINTLRQIGKENLIPFDNQISEVTGIKPSETRIKSVPRMDKKIRRYQGRGLNPREIPNGLGARIEVQENEIYQQLEKVKNGFNVLSVDDYFKNPTEKGYKGINVTVRLPNGMLGEIQIHTAESAKFARDTHLEYVKAQEVEESTQTPVPPVKPPPPSRKNPVPPGCRAFTTAEYSPDSAGTNSGECHRLADYRTRTGEV